jgi:hypothetical protein
MCQYANLFLINIQLSGLSVINMPLFSIYFKIVHVAVLLSRTTKFVNIMYLLVAPEPKLNHMMT